MTDSHIRREDDGSAGRYVVAFDDGQEAEMTYRRVREGVIAIDHTFVPPAHRGGGLAQTLVERGIADARAENLRIVPLCSYVEAQFRRHKDWSDLRA